MIRGEVGTKGVGSSRNTTTPHPPRARSLTLTRPTFRTEVVMSLQHLDPFKGIERLRVKKK